MSRPTPIDLPTAGLEGVSVSFEGRTALAEVDFSACAGTLTVITGPNGAGKSTLIEVLAGALAPDAGHRVMSGTVAFVPQRITVSTNLPVTVRDVVAIGAWGRLGLWRRFDATARATIERSMERVDIAPLARRPFSSLSGGQQQRTLLAQGLARASDVLLLDEPTTGLDSDSSIRIRTVMRDEAAAGVAVVCASHDPAVIDDADRVVLLRDGRAARHGGPVARS